MLTPPRLVYNDTMKSAGDTYDTYYCVRCYLRHPHGEICMTAAHGVSCLCGKCYRAIPTSKPSKQPTLTISKCEGCGWDTMFGAFCFYCEQLRELRVARNAAKPLRRRLPLDIRLLVLGVIWLWGAVWMIVFGVHPITVVLQICYAVFIVFKYVQARVAVGRTQSSGPM